MAQIGLYVPAAKAKLSPVDMIYTHFPSEEKPDSNLGRLGEESKRLEEIFKKATRYSLVLLNESLSSTSAGESLYIAKDIVCALKLLGVRAVFATHLHDLALDLDFFNKNKLGDSRVISLVSGVYNVEDTIKNNNEIAIRTYKIIPGPPLGNSYARDIASRFGISLDNLVKTLKERDVVDKNLDIRDFNKKNK
jgi:DNA mismatch repair ATPase MutS